MALCCLFISPMLHFLWPLKHRAPHLLVAFFLFESEKSYVYIVLFMYFLWFVHFLQVMFHRSLGFLLDGSRVSWDFACQIRCYGLDF